MLSAKITFNLELINPIFIHFPPRVVTVVTLPENMPFTPMRARPLSFDVLLRIAEQLEDTECLMNRQGHPGLSTHSSGAPRIYYGKGQ